MTALYIVLIILAVIFILYAIIKWELYGIVFFFIDGDGNNSNDSSGGGSSGDL